MAKRDDRTDLVRHEEELLVGTEPVTVGAVRAEKRVDVEKVAQDVPRDSEQAAVERVPAEEGDSGEIETLPDGSVSIPLLEEQLVVTKRLVVRERIVIRKETVTEIERVEAELRREEIEFDTGRSD